MSTYEPQYVYSMGTVRRWFKQLGDVPDTIVTIKKKRIKQMGIGMQYEWDTKKCLPVFSMDLLSKDCSKKHE